MPIYEFRCSTCGAVFEKICSFSHAEPGVACEACAIGWAERLPSLPCPHHGGAHAGQATIGTKPAASHPPGCDCAMHRPRAARPKAS